MKIKSKQAVKKIQVSIDTIEKPVALIDLKGEIVKVNHQFSNVFSIKMPGSIENVISGESLKIWRNSLQQVVITKKVTCEISMKVSKTSTRIVKVKLSFDGERNLIILCVPLPTKLTAPPQFSYRKTFEESGSLVFVIDNSTGDIQDVNEMTMDFFEVTSEQFLDYNMGDILRFFPKESMNIAKFKQELFQTGYAETLQQYIHPSTQTRHYQVTAIKDFSTNLSLIKIKDDTKKVLVQQQLEQHNALLEVGQLAASIAHEIRNPMTTLKGFTQLLKVSANDDAMRYLTVIEDELDRMDLIIGEMLNLSKPAAGKKERVSLTNLVKMIIRVIGPKATLEGIKISTSFEVSEEPFLMGEEGKLKQVLLNLFKNSLEAMKPGGTLTIYVEECEKNLVNIIIKDTGKGIEAENLNQLFLPYFTTRSEGTGLGLPFVLKTIEEHDGTISVSSKVGEGTSFIITFPVIREKLVPYKWSEKEPVIQ